jgi:type I restriction enzyme S subunit
MEERELPEGWARTTLSELISPDGVFSDGDWVESKDQDPTGNIRLLQLADIGEAKFLDKSSRFVNQDKFAELRCTEVLENDVLIARMPDPLGRACQVPLLQQKAITVVDVAIVRPGVNSVDPRWLMHAINSPEIRETIAIQSTGSTRRRIARGKLADLQFPLPPGNEQKRIAAKLDATLVAVDACRQRLDGVAAILKRFRQAVLSAATSGELTREWREERGLADQKWPMIKTKEAGKVQLGRQRSPKYHHGPTMRPYLRVQNIFEDRIDLADVMEMDFSGADLEKYRLHPGDILLNEGQSPQYLGRPAMYRGEMVEVCFTNSLIRFQSGDSVLSEFALLLFRHYMHSGRYISEGTITTNIAHLSAGRFGEVEFPQPPVEEQQEIVRRAQGLFTLADQFEARLTAARKVVDRLTSALLANAFRGELVPQDPNDEPASVLLERIRAARQAEATAGKPSPRRCRKAVAHP